MSIGLVSPVRAAVRLYEVRQRAQELVSLAQAWGLVLTIEEPPIQTTKDDPLQIVITVRPAHGHS